MTSEVSIYLAALLTPMLLWKIDGGFNFFYRDSLFVFSLCTVISSAVALRSVVPKVGASAPQWAFATLKGVLATKWAIGGTENKMGSNKNIA